MEQHPTHVSPITATPAIKVTSASGLVSCVPYLVGFTPHESLVLVFVSQFPTPRVAVTLRVDVVPDSATCDVRDDVVDNIFNSLHRARAHGVDLDQAHLVVFSNSAADLPARAFVSEMAIRLHDDAVCVGEVIATNGTRMWHYGTPTEEDWHLAGEPVDPGEALQVEFEMVAAEVGFVANREVLAGSLAPTTTHHVTDDHFAAERRARARAYQSEVGAVRWRRAAEDGLIGAMRESYQPAVAWRAAPRWVLALADSRVREPVLYRLLIDTPERVRRARLATARSWLTGLVTMVTGAAAAPVAATLAAVAWQQGDGAFARIAAEHAIVADPANRLGILIATACNSGMPPSTWVEVLAAFSLSELREAQPAVAGGWAQEKD